MFKTMFKSTALALIAAISFSAQANSVGFSQPVYSGASGSVSVTLIFDFTGFSMFGGSVDLIYDAQTLEFVSYTQGPLPPDVMAFLSPVGTLVAPGLYSTVGVGTAFFQGINSAGPVGTFEFNVLGDNDPASTVCGMTLCLLPSGIDPFVSLAGDIVNDEVLANGITAAAVVVPIPAALWSMLAGLGVLFGVGRGPFCASEPIPERFSSSGSPN